MGGGDPENLLIALPVPEDKAVIKELQRRHPSLTSVRYVDTKENEVPAEYFQESHFLITFNALPANPPSSCPNLRFIHFVSAGTNHIAKHPIYTSTSIPLTTSSGIHGPQIAEWVVMTALCSSHKYNVLHDWQRDHRWGKGDDGDRTNRPVHLDALRDKSGQRLGVLGYGSIGRQVARVAAAMGMQVLAYTASPRPDAASRRDRGYIVPGTGDREGTIPLEWYSGLDKKSLHAFLGLDLDMLVISVPLTKQTFHFIGREELAILGGRGSRHTFISNVSRGRIIQQDALVSALKSYADDDPLYGGEGGDPGIRGAALDVTDPEPLPPDSELWDAPNAIVTPHISGLGSAYTERAMDVFGINFEAWRKGERMINVVDREKGY